MLKASEVVPFRGLLLVAEARNAQCYTVPECIGSTFVEIVTVKTLPLRVWLAPEIVVQPTSGKNPRAMASTWRG